jgi:hypothetical protein
MLVAFYLISVAKEQIHEMVFIVHDNNKTIEKN